MNIARHAAVWLTALWVMASAPASWAAAGGTARAALPPVEGEVIVQFKADATVLRKHALAARAAAPTVQAVLGQRAAALGARVGYALAAGQPVGDRMQVMRASGISAEALAARLAADPEVEFAVPNGRQRILASPNDPLYAAVAAGVRPNGPDSGQWYLRAPTATEVSAINVEAAWARTLGSPSVVVAVLDTGVRAEHPDLAGRLLPGYDFVSDAEVANDGGGRDADASDPGDWVTAADLQNAKFSKCEVENSSWHGTRTASLIGAAINDGIGMAGTAPGVKVLPVRVLGKCFGIDSDIQAAMLWAAGIHVDGVPDNPNPARVLNLSLGGAGGCSAAYQSIIDRVIAAGTVVVAAAGNSAGGPVGTPGNCNGVVSVLALRHAGTKVGFSDLGPQISIAAPGGNCVNTAPGSPCLYPILAAGNSGAQGPVASTWSDAINPSVGTSFSAPLVAGTVALMLSQQPALTPAQVRSTLQSTARVFPTSGADNGGTTPVAACRAPESNVEQLQCYCSTAFCGAGMLDAGLAVAAVSGALARIDIATAVPTAGSPVTVSAAASLPARGATVISFLWTLGDGGGIVTGFTSATNAATASLTPSAAGTFNLGLTVVDSLGNRATTTQAVTVAAAPIVTPPPVESGGGGGGGAMSAAWLAWLAAAVMALWRLPARRV